MRRKLSISICLAFMFILFIGNVYAYTMKKDNAVEISAVALSYFPSEAKIVGEGDVFVKQGDLNLWADKVIFLIDRKEIFAKAFLGNKVRIARGKYTLYGSEIYYNALKRRGFVISAEGEARGTRFYGSKVEFELIDTIPAHKFLFFRTKPVKLKKPDFEVTIIHGKFTSCRLYKPTYFISGERIVVYPNGNVRVKKLSLFIGGRKVISLPFDYSFNLRRGRGLMIMPMVGYTASLGWYGGFYIGDIGDSLSFSTALFYSERQGIVGKSNLEWTFSKSSKLSIDVERSEDWDDDSTIRWRTDISLLSMHGNFNLRVSYLMDKKLWVLRDDEDIKTVYSAFPEVSLKYEVSPLLLFMRWGDYREDDVREGKLTLGAYLSWERGLSKTLSFSLESVYLKDYYESDWEREILYDKAMLSWKLGNKFTLMGGYHERKVYGSTPFYFDEYEPLRRYLIGFKKRLGETNIEMIFSYDDLRDSWRDLKGKISFSLGPRFYMSVEPWYYLDEDRWREINYDITYYLCPCGCMSLKVEFHDDLREENDDTLWIKLYVSSASFSFRSGAFPQKDSLIPR